MSKFGTPVRIVAPTIQRFTLNHTVAGSRVMACVVDISVDESGTSRLSAMNNVASHMAGVWQDAMAPIMSPGLSFNGGHWIDLDSLTGTSGTFGVAGGHPGTGTGTMVDTEPPQVTLLVHKSCNPNRSQKNGRMFVPGVGTDWVNNDGSLVGAKVSVINTALGNLLTAITGIGSVFPPITTAWRVTHVHKPDRTNPSTWTWSSTDVTNATVDVKTATQRRRNRK